MMNPSTLRMHDAAGRLYRGLPPSLREHIRQQLELEIIEGRLAPGESVTEESLGSRMGVSRTPVREAMRALEGEGLIIQRRGRSAYVAPRTTPDEARALYSLRVTLEGYLAGRAAERMTNAELETLLHLQQQFKEVIDAARGEAIDLKALIALDSDFHWTIYNAAGSELTSVVASYWGRLLRELYDRAYTSEHPSRFSKQHEKIIRLLRRGEGASVEQAMAAHIETGWRGISVSFGADDSPATAEDVA
jgi:DNA-binding GntR family transcriptional regulator